jgi:hypothetical protein
MQVAADKQAQSLDVTFESDEEREAFYRQALDERTLLLRLAFEPRKGSDWGVACENSVELPARVVTQYDTVGALVAVSFEVEPWSDDLATALRRALGEEPAGEDAAGIEASDEEIDGEEPPEGENQGASPIHRIRELNVGQRAMLAMKASRIERRILLRDGSPQVLQNLLVNPQIEAKEILQLVKSTYVTGAILQRVVGDPRWGKNLEVMTAVVRHPQTPSLLAVNLVERLRTSDLRMMAKMAGGLREGVRRAALKEYLKRTSAGSG